MALEIHTVELRAKDSMSPVFKRVGDSANQSARQVTESFARAGESTRRFNVAAAAMGTAIGASVGILADFSRAAAEDAAGQARLQQAIENTGKSYDEYSDSVDKAIKKGQEKAFSDDATREALVRLTSVTGDAGKSLDQLGLVMDFARARGISLADSATVIGKVMGGNVGILQRYGIAIEDGATATEALALIQARSAGQADVYANSQLGQLDKMKDKWAELAESIGANTGELQQFLLLLPGLSAGATALSGLIGGLGGVGTIAKLLGPAALVVGGASLAYGYSQDSMGTTDTNAFWNNFFKQGAGLMNTILPGNPYDTNKYDQQMAANSVGDALIKIFGGAGSSDQQAIDRANLALGNPAFNTPGNVFNFNEADLKKYVMEQAALAGVTVGEYLLTAAKGAPGLVLDPVSGTYKTPAELSAAQKFRSGGASTDATVYGPPQPYNGPYQANGGVVNPMTPRYYGDIDKGPKGPTGKAIGGSYMNDMSDYRKGPADSASYSADAVRAAIIAEAGAYGILFDGIAKASDATSAFKVAQDGLMGQMGVYSQQQSEYSGQLSAMEEAHNLLNQRVADGIPLTKQQQEFQDNYNTALEIGTGAVEDTVLAQGELGQELLLNKGKMDASKEAQDAYTGATMNLVGIIGDLIFALDGVPTEVKTQIMLEDLASGRVDEYYQKLNALNGYSVTTYIHTVTDDPGLALHQHGGIVAARHGRVLGGGYTLVGEDGPELLAGGRGAGGMVIPAGATRAKMRNQQGGGITITGPITVIANDPMQFQQQLRSSSVMEARW